MRLLYSPSASIGKEREFGMCRTDGARQGAALLPGLQLAPAATSREETSS